MSTHETAMSSVTSHFTAKILRNGNYTVSIRNGHMSPCRLNIPPERKIPGVGGWRWAMHPTPEFCVTQRKIYQHVGIFCVG